MNLIQGKLNPYEFKSASELNSLNYLDSLNSFNSWRKGEGHVPQELNSKTGLNSYEFNSGELNSYEFNSGELNSYEFKSGSELNSLNCLNSFNSFNSRLKGDGHVPQEINSKAI